MGASIDYKAMFGNVLLVALATAAIVVIKAAVLFILFKLMREKFCDAVQQSALLFQGSEFLFVVLAMPYVSESVDTVLLSTLISAVAISMALTSIVFDRAEKLALNSLDPNDQINPMAHGIPKLIIVGMNDIGLTVARALQRFDIPYWAVEHNYDLFLNARLKGFPVIFGDKSDLRFWDTMGVKQFEYAVISSPDIALAKAYAPIFKEHFPDVKRYAAVKNKEEGEAYEALDNIAVLSVGAPQGLEMAERLLNDLRMKPKRIAKWIAAEQKCYLDTQGKVFMR